MPNKAYPRKRTTAETIWSLLNNPIEKSPANPPKIAYAASRGYRLTDILIVKFLSLLLPEYTWTVATSAKARRIDIHGERVLFDIPELDIRARELVVGICLKLARSKIDINQLSSEILWIVGQNEPAHLILAAPVTVSDKTHSTAKRNYETSMRRAFVLLTRSELEQLFRYHFTRLADTVLACLPPKKATQVASYFQAPITTSTLTPSIELSYIPSKGETGKPFLMCLNICPSLLGLPILLKWIWPNPELEASPSAPSLQLISPPEVGHKYGLVLDCVNQLSITIRLKFRGFRPGRQSLGKVLLCNPDGTAIKELGLGEIDLVEQYNPAFYREPYVADLNAFDELLGQTEAGRLHTVIVTGLGGAGKTRICEEFGFSAEQRGFRWISRSHPNHQDQPYKIFGDLLRSLVPEPPSEESPSDVVLRYLASLNPSLAEASVGIAGALYTYDRSGSKTPESFKREILLRALLTLIVDQSTRRPLCLHLSDLHWCSTPALTLLDEAINRIKELDNSRATRVVFILEGRIGEALREVGETVEYSHSAAVAWEAFIERTPGRIFQIRPMSSGESKTFLRYLFENTESLERRVPQHLIPHQEELLQDILRFGEGNPFHMIEQIRLLRHLNVVEQNVRTGLLFLSQQVPRFLEVPPDVRIIIRKRFTYLQQHQGDIATLIRAIALIGDRIDSSLFNRLRIRLCPSRSIDQILSPELLLFPQGASGEVRFRHENYYQAIKDIDILERDAVVNTYRQWLEDQKPTAEILFQLGCVINQGSAPDREEIFRLFADSWRAFEAQKKFPMSVRVLERLLHLLPDSAARFDQIDAQRLYESIEYRALLAKRVTWTGDWGHARDIYTSIVEITETLFRQPGAHEGIDRERLDYNLCSAHAELANIEITMLRYSEAIHRLEQIIPELHVNARVSTDEKEKWQSLLLRATNRLAIALWFEGELARALLALRQSLRLSTALGDILQTSIQLRDLGTARIHTNPDRAHYMLARSLSLLSGIEHLPRQEYIVIYQKCMAEILANQRKSLGSLLACARLILPDLEEVYANARREGYVHEEAGSALIIGACHALLMNLEAFRWLKKAISTAHRASLFEFLWKGHLNLAQLCIGQAKSEWEGAGLHAQQAQKLIEVDLSRRNGLQQDKRKHFYRLPLAQLMRIWRSLNDEREHELSLRYPKINDLFETSSSPKLIAHRHERKQPLHVSLQDCDFFLMN